MKSRRLSDLEYYLPAEYIQEAVSSVDVLEEEESAWVAENDVVRCSSCGRDSDIVPIVSLFYKGKEMIVCLRCFKRAMSYDQSKQKESQSPSNICARSATAEQQSEDRLPDGSLMSMFD